MPFARDGRIDSPPFRSVYGTVIEKWFKAEQEKVLGASYPLLGFVND